MRAVVLGLAMGSLVMMGCPTSGDEPEIVGGGEEPDPPVEPDPPNPPVEVLSEEIDASEVTPAWGPMIGKTSCAQALPPPALVIVYGLVAIGRRRRSR